MASDVDILLTAVDRASKELNKINKELGNMEGATKGASKSTVDFDDILKDFTKGIGITAAAIVGVGLAAKKAFDLAEEGAQVLQTAESFDLLLEKVGAAPDLLEQLEDAGGGTVDQMTLMTSTAKLLAGTTGTLSTEMAAAAPQLLEVSRAAVKLDPTIGTVAQTFQSLATGIKKNQPLLIDNANIAVKVGAANERMAESLGKSVGELTEEEKALALLNDTLRAGDALIDQVGGTVESATDEFAKLRATIKDASDEAKTKLVPTFTKVIRSINDTIRVNDLLNIALENNIISTLEFNKMGAELKLGLLDENEVIEELTQKIIAFEEATNKATISKGFFKDGMEDAAVAVETVSDAVGPTTEEIRSLKESLDDADAASRGASAAQADYVRSLMDTKTAADDAEEKITDLIDAVDRDLVSPIQPFIDDLKFLQAGGAEINKLIEEIMESADERPIEVTEELLKAAAVVGVDIQNELDILSTDQAVAELEKLGIGPAEAIELLTGTGSVEEALQRLTATEWVIDVGVNFIPRGLPGGIIPGLTDPSIVIDNVHTRSDEATTGGGGRQETQGFAISSGTSVGGKVTAGINIFGDINFLVPSGMNGTQLAGEFIDTLQTEVLQLARAGAGFTGL
jgi:hypothetical protein